MALHPRYAVALATVLVLAGCAGFVPGAAGPTPADIEPRVASANSVGGQCADDPGHGFVVESSSDDGVRTVTVAGNVTVSGAHYVVEETAVSRVADRSFRLDVNTTADSRKPAKTCSVGGIVPYEVTLELPATEGFELEIRHDGEPVSGIGAGPEP